VSNGLEADDAMSILHTERDDTIICSRDKDLRQVPGWSYSWELGRQPSFGPIRISKAGSLSLSEDRKKLTGTGLAFFYSQLLTGDRVDNIPGLPGCGPVAAWNILNPSIEAGEDLFDVVKDLYNDDDYLLEQGKLLWMTRRLHPDGSPVLWEIGMEQ
jgi:5'-3' exonuclease